jgi:hypothetical protein
MGSMIEIDCKEFRGDRSRLAEFLREKLKAEVRVERNEFRIGSSGRPDGDVSVQEVKNLIKRALHHMRMDEYHVTAQEGVISIRQRKTRERYVRKKGAAPSVKQTVPYFFPG